MCEGMCVRPFFSFAALVAARLAAVIARTSCSASCKAPRAAVCSAVVPPALFDSLYLFFAAVLTALHAVI
jgi:hypothetical protein